MINKKLITEFKDIQSKILKLDKLYHRDSKSNISDGEYDALKKNIIILLQKIRIY